MVGIRQLLLKALLQFFVQVQNLLLAEDMEDNNHQVQEDLGDPAAVEQIIVLVEQQQVILDRPNKVILVEQDILHLLLMVQVVVVDLEELEETEHLQLAVSVELAHKFLQHLEIQILNQTHQQIVVD